MATRPTLLEILACPKDKGPLCYLADESSVLYNPRLQLAAIAVRDDIPVMLIDEADTRSPTEHDRLIGQRHRSPIRACSPTFAGLSTSAVCRGNPLWSGAACPGGYARKFRAGNQERRTMKFRRHHPSPSRVGDLASGARSRSAVSVGVDRGDGSAAPVSCSPGLGAGGEYHPLRAPTRARHPRPWHQQRGAQRCAIPTSAAGTGSIDVILGQSAGVPGTERAADVLAVVDQHHGHQPTQGATYLTAYPSGTRRRVSPASTNCAAGADRAEPVGRARPSAPTGKHACRTGRPARPGTADRCDRRVRLVLHQRRRAEPTAARLIPVGPGPHLRHARRHSIGTAQPLGAVLGAHLCRSAAPTAKVPTIFDVIPNDRPTSWVSCSTSRC